MIKDDLLKQINTAVEKGDAKKLKQKLNELDGDMLLVKDIRPVVNLYISLLLSKKAPKVSGLENIFINIAGDVHKFSQEDFKEIAQAISENIECFQLEHLQWAAADFIARNLTTFDAERIFEEWQTKNTPASKEMAAFGLDVLRISAHRRS